MDRGKVIEFPGAKKPNKTAPFRADCLAERSGCHGSFFSLLVIIGAINWGLVGLFQFDLIAFLFGGAGGAGFPRAVYHCGCGGAVEHLHALSPRRDDAHDECARGRRERLIEAQKTEKLFSLPCGGEYFYHLSRSWATFAQKC